MLTPRYRKDYLTQKAPLLPPAPGQTPPYIPELPTATKPPRYAPLSAKRTGAGNPFAEMIQSVTIPAEPKPMVPPPYTAPQAPRRVPQPPIGTGELPYNPLDDPLRPTPLGMPQQARSAFGSQSTLNDGGDGAGGGNPNDPNDPNPAEPDNPPPPAPQDPPPPPPPVQPNGVPTDWTQFDWETANRWLAGAAAEGYGEQYKWLITPEGRDAMRDFHRDADNLRALGITNLQFTDWARMEGHNSPIDRGTLAPPQSHTQMGGSASDYETMIRWLAHGAAQYGADAMKPYAEHMQRAPGSITAYHNDLNYAKSQGYKEFHYVDWLKMNGVPSPLAGQISAESTANAAAWYAHLHQPPTPPPGGGGWPHNTPPPQPPAPPTPPPTTPPPPVPPTPPPTPPPQPPAPPTPPPTTPPPGTGDPWDFEGQLSKQISDYEKRVNPLFQQQRDDIQRRTLHAGALTGALNSGGFGETLNDALAQQYAQEQSTVAPQIAAMSMNAQALALDKFKTDMNTILTREQIASNADLERSAQALQKYGIDHNDLLERYKADLALKGIQYSSNAQVNAASLNAAAGQAAAAAQLEASRYATDMRYRTDLFQGDVARERNIMDYILGLGAINKDWMDLFLAADPFGFLTGNQPPGQVVIQP